MSVWEDVVATGLIGTDRRPVPRAAGELGYGARSDRRSRTRRLDARCPASRCRASWRAPPILPGGRVAPPNRVPVASPAAHEILAGLLSPPQVDLLNLWLTRCRHGQRVSAAYWTLWRCWRPGALT